MNANVKVPGGRAHTKSAQRGSTSKTAEIVRQAPSTPAPVKRQALAGTQTLARGLEVIDAVANGSTTLTDLAAAIGLTRSTTHRLAATLVERRYLVFSRNDGYALGPKLLELGYVTGRRMDLPRVAREHLEALRERGIPSLGLRQR